MAQFSSGHAVRLAFAAAALAALTDVALANTTPVSRSIAIPAATYRFGGVPYDRLFSALSAPHVRRGAKRSGYERARALAGPAYAIRDLGAVTGFQAGYPLGVNNIGDIAYFNNCGCVGNYAQGDTAAVIHDDGTYTTIFDFEAGDVTYSATPYAINNAGDEAGEWSQRGPVRTLINHSDWTPAARYYDPAYADDGSFALALNDANVSVGQAPIAGGLSAALFSITPAGGEARPKALKPPKGTSWIGTATGINDAGEIVGYATFGKGDGRAVRFFTSDYATVIPVGAPGVSTSAQALNQHGDVVGNAGSAAFLYRNNRTTYLPRPPGDEAGNAVAVAVNASDEVVGNIFTSGGGETAFLYANGRSYDLNSLLPANSGWQIGSVSGINDKGEIVGVGSNANATGIESGAFSMKPQ